MKCKKQRSNLCDTYCYLLEHNDLVLHKTESIPVQDLVGLAKETHEKILGSFLKLGGSKMAQFFLSWPFLSQRKHKNTS